MSGLHEPHPNRRAVRAARLIAATRFVDRAYRLLDRLRSEVVLALASDEVLAQFNEFAYAAARDYDPGSSSFRRYLFPWEEQVIDGFFPPPPARLLIGGAGGGREVLALARRGYQVVAFEPSRSLAQAMAEAVGADLNVQVYRARYEDLPHLGPVTSLGKGIDLVDESPFDAAILGWTSFSHLTTTQHRLAALRAFERVTLGPVLVSFLRSRSVDPGRQGARGRLRRVLPNRRQRVPGDAFSMSIGFYHEIDDDEMLDLAGRAGLKVVHLSSDDRDTNWPHAVMFSKRRELPDAGGGP